MTSLPRVVIAAPASGHGKTTVATGLMAALRRAGNRVSGHKVGPDYIDPGYHSLATGRPGRNLDPHLVGEHLLVPLLLHGALTPEPADIAVIEGVMGLHDGALGRDGFASTAHVARVIGAPVIVVVDISAAARTVAAVVHGLATFDRGIRIAGVILNKAGSARHAQEVTESLEATGVPVLGVLRRDDGITAPSRHLGLLPVAERPDAASALDRLAEQVAAAVDLAAVRRIAHAAPDLVGRAWSPTDALSTLSTAKAGHRAAPHHGAPVVAVAGGRAFTFRYAETDELLRAAGLDPVVFDPTRDTELPPRTAGVYLGGGFPEVHAADLAANGPMRDALLGAVRTGAPTIGECAGLLYLGRTLDSSPMVGALPCDSVMTERLTLGYRVAVAPADTLCGPAGTRVTGHEFHRTAAEPSSAGAPAWLIDGHPEGFSADPGGLGAVSLHASYLHQHWAGNPAVAAAFARAVVAHARRGHDARAHAAVGPTVVASGGFRAPAPVATPPASAGSTGHRPGGSPVLPSTHSTDHPIENLGTPTRLDLLHHGDRDVQPGLVDLAVNVRLSAPPPWLTQLLRATVDDLAHYPRAERATAAIAVRHRRPESEVLPTAGGAESFTLLARALRPRHAVVVHPQFTEPEAALIAAGHRVHRVLLAAADGFRLSAAHVPADADLVMIGNPTNPTGRLHPAGLFRALARPGRTLVIDEAFMDAVPGEPETLTGERIPGLVVLRSLTKTWGIAGLRVGYAVGDPAVIAKMRAQQPPWSVSTLALAAIEACCSPDALREAATTAEDWAVLREVLTDGLRDLGMPAVANSAAPFVLVDTWPALPVGAPPDLVRQRLRDKGYAVRRGDTFPGLGPSWIRIAIRDPATTRRLLDALAQTIQTIDPMRAARITDVARWHPPLEQPTS